jgi:hypothetical protein
MISVIVPSYRLGGLDVLSCGLSQQKFRDFELVFVDCLYDFRKETVPAYLKTKNFKFKHIKPSPFKYPVDAVPSCRNTGLRAAEGELIVWWVDYTFAPAHCLEKHWNLYQSKDCCSIGIHEYLTMPKLKDSFKVRPETSLEEYQKIVENTREFDTSIFEVEFAGIEGLEKGSYTHPDPKTAHPDGPIIGDTFHAKNEAVPSWVHEKVGGFDEKFDGGHGWDDMDMGRRLAAATTLWLDKSNVAYIINPRQIFEKARPLWTRGLNENLKLLNNQS